MAGYRNFEVDLQNNKLIRLPNLPMNFNGGSCASYDFQEDWEPSEGGEAVLCSSLHYSGIPDLVGRECFKFDGETYGMIWYTNKNHIGGNMVSWPSVRGFYNIGGGEYEDNLFHFESWAGSKLGGYDGYWNIDYSSDDPKLVTLTGFTVIKIPYRFRQMVLMSRTRNFFMLHKLCSISYKTRFRYGDGIMIFGGYRSYPIEPNSQAWWVDGKYWNLQRYPEQLKQSRHQHASIYLGFVRTTFQVFPTLKTKICLRLKIK